MPRDTTAADADWQEQLADWVKERSAYSIIQGTRPQTLAYGLTDSPTGPRRGSPRSFTPGPTTTARSSAIARDDMLANISLYWFTGAIGSSFWTYYARTHGPWPVPFPITVPTATPLSRRKFCARRARWRYYTNIQRWTAMEKGGHFAALEQPQALARDIGDFFASYKLIRGQVRIVREQN